MRASTGIAIALAVLACGAVGCGGDGDAEGGGQSLSELGRPEGALNLIALPGYVEDGTRDPGIDWVTPFERSTGCEVTQTVAESPAEVIRLLRGGDFDGVSARGDVNRRLIAEGLVDPVNTELIPSYTDVFEGLRERGPQLVDGDTWGVPQGRVANLIMWRIADIEWEPDREGTLGLIFDPELAARARGRISVPDTPMHIAEAALYLRKHDPELGIENPYELDREQLDAAIELLREQERFVNRYWSNPLENARAFERGSSLAGIGLLATANRILAEGVRFEAVIPTKEGTSGISDTWMLTAGARHPHCMYLWMDHIIGPEANAAVSKHTSQAPANERACGLVPVHCDVYRAADEDYFDEVEYWAAPLRDCGDDRGRSCTGYGEWARAFAELKRER